MHKQNDEKENESVVVAVPTGNAIDDPSAPNPNPKCQLATKTKIEKAWWQRLEAWTDAHETALFTFRITTAFMCASLFQLLNTDLPEPIWVIITAGLVMLQPNNDMGSVIKKVWQRSFGTAVGGGIGLGVGAISLVIQPTGSPAQAAYLGVATALVMSILIYSMARMGLRMYYSAALGSLTAGFVILAFYNKSGRDAWSTGVFRIINIIIGGLIASGVSLVVFPETTIHVIEKKVEGQMKLTGKAAKEVLSLLAKKPDGKVLPSYQEIVANAEVNDPAHSAYLKGISTITSVKMLFDILSYDPGFRCLSKEAQKDFVVSNRVKLGRILRTQMNIVQIDNLLRSGYIQVNQIDAELMQKIGQHLSVILDRSKSIEEHKEAKTQLLENCLPAVQREVDRCLQGKSQKISRISGFGDFDEILSSFQEQNSRYLSYINENFDMEEDLVYQQVEILIIRCLRLHHIWPLQNVK